MHTNVRKICDALRIGGLIAVLLLLASEGSAEDRIQTFVTTKGKLVYTNIVENPPASEPQTPAQPAPAPPIEARVPAPIRSLVDTISRSHGIDPELVLAMMKTESDFNRWAVSPKGAMGLMQLIPATGRRFGVQDFFDPQQNIQGGVRYLRFLLDKFDGNVELSLAAYNAGENLVARLGRVPAITETQNYVRKIRSIYTRDTASFDQNPLASEPPADGSTQEPEIFKSVNERGVVRFSNIGP